MKNKWKYLAHFKEHAEGSCHNPEQNSFTIVGAAATHQDDIDKLGRKICRALNKELKEKQ